MKFPFGKRRTGRRAEMTLDEWAGELLKYQELYYPLGLTGSGTLGSASEKMESSFAGYVEGYKGNSVLFACMDVRMKVFSEARFQWRKLINGRPGDLFGTPALRPLETPWENGSTSDLLKRLIQDADIAGNFYATTQGVGFQKRIVRLRPDWVIIVLGSFEDDAVPGDLSWELMGYGYQPGGPASGNDIIPLLPEDVAHFAPIPDPLAQYRGMSPISPIVREIVGDNQMSTHKNKFFEKGASPNMIISFDPTVNVGAMKDFVDNFRLEHEGSINAYKTLFLGGGADAKITGRDLGQIAFSEVQGHGETRIAAALGTPPVLAGLSEGLDAATYSNYAQARRRFADGTLRPLWRDACSSLQKLVTPPGNAHLWYDTRDIAFLREDEEQQSTIAESRSRTIKQLVEAGFTPESVVKAIDNDDFTLLSHTGLFSVQLQPAGSKTPDEPGTPPAPDDEEPESDETPPTGG